MKQIKTKNKQNSIRITWHRGAFANHFCRTKAISITYLSGCACVLVPGRMSVCMCVRACNSYAPYCDVICGPAAAPYFSTSSHKRRDFRRKVIEHKMFVLILLETKLKILSSPVLSDFRNNTAFLKVPRFRSFVLLRGTAYKWRWVRSSGGIVLTGETKVLEAKTCSPRYS
jgi:hypothetical protein